MSSYGLEDYLYDMVLNNSELEGEELFALYYNSIRDKETYQIVKRFDKDHSHRRIGEYNYEFVAASIMINKATDFSFTLDDIINDRELKVLINDALTYIFKNYSTFKIRRAYIFL